MKNNNLYVVVVLGVVMGTQARVDAAPARRKPSVAGAPKKRMSPPKPVVVDPEPDPAPEPIPDKVVVVPAPPAPAVEKAAAPDPAPAVAPEASAKTLVDLPKLRADYNELKDALFRSRARREALEGAILGTQMVSSIVWDGGARFVVKAAEIRLDGVRIWEAAEGQLGEKTVELGARALPPGPHVVGVRVEIRPRANPKLGYVSEQTFALSFAEGKKTRVAISIDEDGSPPSYNPDIEIEIDEE